MNINLSYDKILKEYLKLFPCSIHTSLCKYVHRDAEECVDRLCELAGARWKNSEVM